MGGAQLGGIGIGAIACLLGIAGIFGAVRRYRGREAIASTFGQTGGIAYTAVQAGCSGLLILGGLALAVVALFVRG